MWSGKECFPPKAISVFLLMPITQFQLNKLKNSGLISNEGYDVVIGSIEVQGAEINEHAQWYRRFLGSYSKYLIRIVAGFWRIHDTQRAFKLFTAKSATIFFRGPKLIVSVLILKFWL